MVVLGWQSECPREVWCLVQTENIAVKLTIPIQYDTPNRNGVIFTKDAINNMLRVLIGNKPIVFRDNFNMCGTIIGVTNDNYDVEWDDENKVCKLVVDGMLYYGGMDINVREMIGNTITQFESSYFGISSGVR